MDLRVLLLMLLGISCPSRIKIYAILLPPFNIPYNFITVHTVPFIVIPNCKHLLAICNKHENNLLKQL